MKQSFLAIIPMLFALHVNATELPTTVCEEGDYFITLQVSTGRDFVKAGITEFTSSQAKLNLYGQRVAENSEGHTKSYKVTNQDEAYLVLSFDANGKVELVRNVFLGVVIQSFANCAER
ncbi:MAG: hypothetical protein EOP06_14245 [Proteobacteria bacterium]|nr:MAG: hypothetical protein EOP06_14245 [Pseudomonadota bacterium]